MLTGHVADLLISHGLDSLSQLIGKLLGVGMTSFFEVQPEAVPSCFHCVGSLTPHARSHLCFACCQIPSERLVSLAFTTFFGAYPNSAVVPLFDKPWHASAFPSPSTAQQFVLGHHPR